MLGKSSTTEPHPSTSKEFFSEKDKLLIWFKMHLNREPLRKTQMSTSGLHVHAYTHTHTMLAKLRVDVTLLRKSLYSLGQP